MFAIGSSLKETRLRMGLDLPAAAEATKIRTRHLKALEDEQFDILPGQTYVRGFLKTYADFLGLDGQLYVDEYSSRFWVNEDGSSGTRRKVRVRRKHHGRIELNMIVLTLVAIAGVTALVIAAWTFGGARPAATPKKPSAPTVSHHAGSAPPLRLLVKAVDGSSVIEVRMLAGSGSAGRLLYHGTLERGESQSFTGRSLWLSVSSPRHVVLSPNGAGWLYLHGLCPRIVTVTPHRIAQTVSCH